MDKFASAPLRLVKQSQIPPEAAEGHGKQQQQGKGASVSHDFGLLLLWLVSPGIQTLFINWVFRFWRKYDIMI